MLHEVFFILFAKQGKVIVEKLFPKIDSEGVFLADNQKGVTRNRIPGKLFSYGGEKSVNDGVALLMMDPLVGSLASVRALH